MNTLIKIIKRIVKGSIWAFLLVGGFLLIGLIWIFVFTYYRILYFIIPFLVVSYLIGTYLDFCCEEERKNDNV